MKLEFRYARVDEYPAIAAFLNDHWAANHVYVRDKKLFDWTFHGHGWLDGDPWAKDANHYTFVLGEAEGQLVAALGGIPYELNDHGTSARGVWLANYLVRADHRKGTAALQLIQSFRRPPFRTVIASGLNPATTVIYKVLRGLVLPPMPRHFGVLPGKTGRMNDLLRLAHGEWDATRAETLTAQFSIPSIGAAPASGSALPADWDSANWSVIAKETVGTARNARYLNWRYVNHPTFQYRIVTVPDGGRTGLAVWRLQDIRRKEGDTLVDVDKIGRIVEFLPASPGNAAKLAAALLSQVDSAGALAIDFYGYNGPVRAALEAAGLRSTAASADGVAIPSRFQPLDGHDGTIMNAMFVDGTIEACTDQADCAWYWTKSDSDQDRPN